MASHSFYIIDRLKLIVGETGSNRQINKNKMRIIIPRPRIFNRLKDPIIINNLDRPEFPHGSKLAIQARPPTKIEYNRSTMISKPACRAFPGRIENRCLLRRSIPINIFISTYYLVTYCFCW